MTQNPPNDQPEMLIYLGLEGGSLTLFRRRIEVNRWEFWRETRSIDMDENDDEVWRTHIFASVPSWESLIEQIGTEWIVYVPRKIQPEYRDLIRMAIRKRIPQLNEHLSAYWRERAQERWREALHLDSNEEI